MGALPSRANRRRIMGDVPMRKDKRYSVELEYCGYKEAKYVVRFCGKYIAPCDTKQEAMAMVVKLKGARDDKL